ncbi:MAG: S1 RNA-binding domain-containing protein, partial [Deltaproteobacteria bacterium]
VIEVKDGKISLSIKALKEDPWKGLDKKYPKGSSVRGKVAKINPYGALVRLEGGIQALMHISEFASEEEMRT